MTADCEDVSQRAFDMGAGEAFRIGRDLGHPEGWQRRDRKAVSDSRRRTARWPRLPQR